jgi:hypothetical protein
MALGAVRGHGKHNCPMVEQLIMAQPEYRLKAGSSQDRSVNSQYARTTDKGVPQRDRYTVCSTAITNETVANTRNDRRIHGAGC